MLLRTLARLCFPSWAFFDVAGPVAELEGRASGDDAWRPLVRPRPRGFAAAFTNPDGLGVLAAQTLVERWHRELEEGLGASATEAQLRAYAHACGAAEFRLVVRDGDATAIRRPARPTA